MTAVKNNTHHSNSVHNNNKNNNDDKPDVEEKKNKGNKNENIESNTKADSHTHTETATKTKTKNDNNSRDDFDSKSKKGNSEEFGNLTLYGLDADRETFKKAYGEFSDEDIAEAIGKDWNTGKPLHITLADLETGTNGQAEVGGDEIIIDTDVLKGTVKEDGKTVKLQDVFGHELAHTMGYSHDSGESEEVKFNDMLQLLTDGNNSSEEITRNSTNTGIENYNSTANEEEHHGVLGMTDHSMGSSGIESSDMGGHGAHDMSAGGITKELNKVYDIIGPAIGMDIEGEFTKLFQDYKNQHPDGGTPSEKAKGIETAAKKLSETIVQKISDKIATIMEDGQVDDTEKAFMDSVASWLKMAVHSTYENGEVDGNEHGLHMLADGSSEQKKAFQIAHVMNAGNDTIMGTLRGTQELQNLDGASLMEFIEKNGGNFLDLFKSKGKTADGRNSNVKEGEFSSFYGASGDAAMSAQGDFKMGARQNIWSAHDAFGV